MQYSLPMLLNGWNGLPLILVAASMTLMLLLALIPLASRLRLLDEPDRPGGRKLHARPTPTIGGLAMFLGVCAAMPLLAPSQEYQAFLAAGFLLIGVGLLDDAYDVPWYWRILAQTIAVLVMIYWGGVRVEYVGVIFSTTPLELGPWAVPFTLIGALGVINAFNMCDGVDGLAGSLCLAALGMFAIAALYAGNGALFSGLLPILAVVGVFLLYNMRFPWQSRARVFMGNAGSAFLGLAMAWAAIRLTQNTAHPVSPALAPWLLAPPLIDCLVLTVRRIKLGRSPFHADRDHMHHLLLDAGFSPAQVAVGLTVLSCTLALAAALVLRTNAGTETHLVVGFAALTLGYYWLTARRIRAVRAFSQLREAFVGVPLIDAPSLPAPATAAVSSSQGRDDPPFGLEECLSAVVHLTGDPAKGRPRPDGNAESVRRHRLARRAELKLDRRCVSPPSGHFRPHAPNSARAQDAGEASAGAGSSASAD